ncbi:MAG TPA: sigma-54 dependent transcriptional regulator, partial [Steroidobacteraceae bacterium]
ANVLRAEGYPVTTCSGFQEARTLLHQSEFDVALIDVDEHEAEGLELLKACRDRHPEMLVIAMSGNPTVSSSIEAMRAGAWNYLPKPFSANHLQVLLGRAAYEVMSNRQHRAEDERPAEVPSPEEVPLIGRAENFRAMMAIARKAAVTDASIFISGESGSGKEQVAQFIHRHSRRASRPLIAVNCAALPEQLLESEMFGHVKGAFTGATRDKPGLLEIANGGTLFLDELTEMPITTQAKLLRVLQDGVVRRLGSNTVDAVVNVRFMAATNRDPRTAIEAGVLRKDLYYRLRVVPLRVPPLRERPEDIPLLAEHFLHQYWRRHREGAGPPPRFSEAAIESLKKRVWRGNVRELQNVIEHSVVLLQPGTEIQSEDLPQLEESAADGMVAHLTQFSENDAFHGARERVIGQFERSYLTWLVNRTNGNMSAAARIASVDRTTLYRLMEKHGIQRTTVIRIPQSANNA